MRLLFLFLLLLSTNLYAQKKQKVEVIYDVIYMKDGRVLKGEILLFQEKDGDITFKDSYGRKYSITRAEYKYFVEDMSFNERKKNDTLIINPRKEFEMQYSIGLSIIASKYTHEFVADDYFLSSNWNGSFFYIPMCLNLGVGKYFGRQHYLGLNTDIAFLSMAKNFYNVGLRYNYQYDSHKNNKAFYTPVQVQYSSSQVDVTYNVNDSIVETQFGGTVTYYPIEMTKYASIQSMGISIGQGISFIRENKRSWSMELSFFKNFIMNQKILDLNRTQPNSTFKNSGLKFSFFYNI